MGEGQADATGNGSEGNSNAGNAGEGKVTTAQVGVEEKSSESPTMIAQSFDFGQVLPEEKTQFTKIIPPDFANETFVKELLKTDKPTTEMFKQMKNLQTKLGERPSGIIKPGPEATEEQKQAYNKQMGVPDSAEGYEIKPITWSDEEKEAGQKVEASRNPEIIKAMQKAAHKRGLPKEAFEGMLEDYDREVLRQNKLWATQQQEEVKKQDADFDKRMNQRFGPKLNEVKRTAREFIDSNADDAEKAAFRSLSNEQAINLASFIQKIHNKYEREDGYTAGTTSGGGMSATEAKEERMRLMQTPAYTDFQHVEHSKVKARVKELYKY